MVSVPEETRIVEIVFPTDTNSMGTLFGGRALSLMDRLAFIVASRFARKPVVTACSEKVEFRTAVKEGNLIESGRAKSGMPVAWSVLLFFLPMVLHFIAVFSDTARWFARLFPDYYYRPHTILMGIESPRVLAPLAIMAVCVIAAVFFAERRDLSA